MESSINDTSESQNEVVSTENHEDEQSSLNELQTRDDIFTPIRTEIPASDLDFDFGDFASTESKEKVQKRASNVMKLAEENKQLSTKLKAMTDKLEAAERKRKALEERLEADG